MGTTTGTIDSHAHLDFAKFDPDRDEVLERAWAAGLSRIVTIGSGQGTEGVHNALAVAAGHERVYATAGVHPHDADLGMAWEGDPQGEVGPHLRADWEVRRDVVLARMGSAALHPKVVAVGESGLDYHYDRSPRDLQRELFRSFIRLAHTLDMPLVIHTREATGDTLRILESEGVPDAGGVIHCFSGDRRLARVGLEAGLHFGLTGPITFKRATELREVVAGLPLERLLVETDSPYLAPVPHRGRRNEPAFVVEVIRALAQLKGVSVEEVAEVTAANTRRLFRLDRIESGPAGRIVYPYGQALYINLTNRCTLACGFCLKRSGHELGGIPLALLREPTAAEILEALDAGLAGDVPAEVVFCGIGEPLLRLEVVREVAAWLKPRGLRVRVNTDGLASLFLGQDVAAALADRVDAVNVSLNAPNALTYARLCPSVHGESAFEAVCAFVQRCVQLFPAGAVETTAVALPGVDLDATRALTASLGASFRVRPAAVGT